MTMTQQDAEHFETCREIIAEGVDRIALDVVRGGLSGRDWARIIHKMSYALPTWSSTRQRILRAIWEQEARRAREKLTFG